MFNSINKIFSKYTGLLIRMDDICENMNWIIMEKCELLFDKYKIKPLLGVIPANKDPELLTYPKTELFWDKVKNWKNKGWEITMHGCNHLYTQKSDKNDVFNYGGDSEFYGLEFSKQLSKIELGLSVSKRQIKIRSFFAPNHIYDQNTLEALKKDIKVIIDGYGLFPFYKDDLLLFLNFFREIFLPFGIQSTQLHINYWDNKDFERFENFIVKHHNKIVDLDYINRYHKPQYYSEYNKFYS